jgi:mRNA interferase MazF
MIPFEIVLVPFPFADLTSSKRRPCLVLASFRPKSMGEHLILAMMTSQVKPPNFPHDVILKNFEEAGLPKATLVRLSKIVTLDSSMVYKKLGKLSKKDQAAIKIEFGKLFASVK